MKENIFKQVLKRLRLGYNFFFKLFFYVETSSKKKQKSRKIKMYRFSMNNSIRVSVKRGTDTCGGKNADRKTFRP